MLNILKDKRILFLSVILLLSISLILFKGINYGIEFEGGVRIPITFDRDLTPTEIEEVSNIIKTRISNFGLSQVIVRPLPPRELQIELAKGDESSIEQIEKLLQQRGSFEAIINNRVAITGQDILSGSIGDGRITALSRDTYRWEVDFAITESGASKFAAVALGQANKPVHMFLDRPHNAIILLDPRLFPEDADVSSIITSVNSFNSIENSNLKFIIIDNWEIKKSILLNEMNNSNMLIIAAEDSFFASELDNYSENVKLLSDEDFTFEMYYNQVTGEYIINQWKAIGLLSSPTLSEGLAQGAPSRLVSVSGSTYDSDDAYNDARNIKSILSGGRLPVNALVGSTVSIPAPLGKQFLDMSVLGGLIAMTLIILFVTLRYRSPKLFIPIIVITSAEIIILISILGGFGTIDFAAMAGIIAALGTSIDSQIIITDELLKKKGSMNKEEMQQCINRAFFIIARNVATAVVAMLPLFFSGIVEVVGFATSTIFGALLGLVISRPAYAAIVEKLDIAND
jgi:preprotein translocase subunit SecD